MTTPSWKDNPHAPGTPEFNDWTRAYIREHQSRGTEQYDAALRVADARLAALKEQMAPSPATVAADAIYDEIDPPRPPEPLVYLNWGGNTFTLPASSVQITVHKAEEMAQKVSDAFAAMQQTFSVTLKGVEASFRLFDEMIGPKGRPKQRKQTRLCPRHNQPAHKCRMCWR